jgi:hypothetical protein
MSILERIEDWFIRKTLPPLEPIQPSYYPAHDRADLLLSLTMYLVLCLTIVATCGTYCAAK